jgi:hypothetical protein
VCRIGTMVGAKVYVTLESGCSYSQLKSYETASRYWLLTPNVISILMLIEYKQPRQRFLTCCRVGRAHHTTHPGLLASKCQVEPNPPLTFPTHSSPASNDLLPTSPCTDAQCPNHQLLFFCHPSPLLPIRM